MGLLLPLWAPSSARDMGMRVDVICKILMTGPADPPAGITRAIGQLLNCDLVEMSAGLAVEQVEL
jgi:hypothetical protein